MIGAVTDRPAADPTLDKSAGQIAGMFDAIAGRYDLLNHLLSAGLDRRWRALAVRALELTGNEMVLDGCTGTADLAIALAAGASGGRGASRVVGIDFAGAMLARGRSKLAQRGLLDRVQLVRSDATQVPMPDGSVDAATIAFGIRNVESPGQALAELHRVVRPGGRIAVLEFGMPTIPGLRALYAWYFRSVLPALGRLVSRHDSAYAYLPASVGQFPSGDAFLRMLEGAGFDAVAARPLQCGIVYLYTAVRNSGEGYNRVTVESVQTT